MPSRTCPYYCEVKQGGEKPMPTSPPSRCSSVGCAELSVNRGRCADHQPEPWVNKSKAWAGGSTRRWRERRDRHLRSEPLCRHCGDEATDVDHIVPLSRGGSKWETENLQSLCEGCHKVKTAEDRIRAQLGP